MKSFICHSCESRNPGDTAKKKDSHFHGNDSFDSKLILLAMLFLCLVISRSYANEYNIKFNEVTALTKDTVLSGRVYVKEKITVPKGVTLTIKPGTSIEFEGVEKLFGDGNITPLIMVEGNIIAVGTETEPIIFEKIIKANMTAPGEIYIMGSENSRFENCHFNGFIWGISWALHLHDSTVIVKDCLFDTYNGIRFKGGKVTIIGNEFLDSDISIRFWEAAPVIENNKFKDVGTAIFMREKGEGTVINNNKFSGVKDYFIKLGEAQQGDITVTGNDFGTTDIAEISKKIYDKEDDEYLGKVIIK